MSRASSRACRVDGHAVSTVPARHNPPECQAAEEQYHEAMALAGALGMRPLATTLELRRGSLYRRMGDSPRARDHLAIAATMCRELSMSRSLAESEAELERLG